MTNKWVKHLGLILVGLMCININPSLASNSANYELNDDQLGPSVFTHSSAGYRLEGTLEPLILRGSSANYIAEVAAPTNPGLLFVQIVNSSYEAVASPSVSMSSISYSFASQISTGSLGSATQRVYVENPNAADSGYTLSIAATSGATAVWNNAGAGDDFDFNEPGGATDNGGGDADALGGQMTVDASVSTLTMRYGGNTGLSKGSSTAFEQGVADSVTLLSAAAGSDNFHAGYLTGISLSQAIPAEQDVDSYSLSMMLTIV